MLLWVVVMASGLHLRPTVEEIWGWPLLGGGVGSLGCGGRLRLYPVDCDPIYSSPCCFGGGAMFAITRAGPWVRWWTMAQGCRGQADLAARYGCYIGRFRWMLPDLAARLAGV